MFMILMCILQWLVIVVLGKRCTFLSDDINKINSKIFNLQKSIDRINLDRPKKDN